MAAQPHRDDKPHGKRRGPKGQGAAPQPIKPPPPPPPHASPKPPPAVAEASPELLQARKPIVFTAEASGQRYLDHHLVRTIDMPALLKLLRVRAERIEVSAPTPWHVRAVDRIERPDWARYVAPPPPLPIEMPDWGDVALPVGMDRLPLLVVGRIVRPRWGRAMRLPVVATIRNPDLDADGGLGDFGQMPDNAWELLDDPVPEPPPPRAGERPKPARPPWIAPDRPVEAPHDQPHARAGPQRHGKHPTDHASRTRLPERAVPEPRKPAPMHHVAASARALEPDAQPHTPDAQPHTPRAQPQGREAQPQKRRIRVQEVAKKREFEPVDEEAEDEVAAPAVKPKRPVPASIVTTSHIGAFGCLGKLVGLLLLIGASLVAVEIALQTWSENHGALVEQLAGAGLDTDVELPTLLAQGEPDAPLQIVLACDLATPHCQRVLGWLLQFRAGNPVQVRPDHDDKPRLVVLHRATGDEARRVAEGLQALDHEGHFWEVMAKVTASPRPLGIGQVQALADDAGVKLARWNRMKAEQEIALRVRTDTTMADALEMPPGIAVLVSGQPIPTEALTTEVALVEALKGQAEGLARLLKANEGDVAQAHEAALAGLPEAVRQRYVAWILRGERAGAPLAK